MAENLTPEQVLIEHMYDEGSTLSEAEYFGRTILAALDGAGFVVVPKEPTAAIDDAKVER